MTCPPMFQFHDTHGIPLWLQLDTCWENGIEPDLLGFIADAHQAGWKWEKVVAVFRDAFFLADVDRLMIYLCYKAFCKRLGWTRAAVWTSPKVVFEAVV